MSSELKVNSIRDTSNNEAITISSGNVSITNTLSAGTIGGNVVFPDGMVNDITIIKMAFDTNGIQNIDDGNSGLTIFTSATDSASGGQNSITTVTGNTYLITFSCFLSCYRISGTIAERNGRVVLYKGNTNMNRGTRSDSFSGTNTELFDSYVGRIATSTNATDRESNVLVTMQGAFYESSGGTYYIFVAGAGANNNVRMTTRTSDGNPAYFTFIEIKGNKLSELS